MGPRLHGSVSASWVRGESGSETDDIFHSAQSMAGLTLGISRNLATAVEYSYFWYDFSPTAAVVEVPGDTRRQSVQVMLKVWAPLFQRPRRPNASR